MAFKDFFKGSSKSVVASVKQASAPFVSSLNAGINELLGNRNRKFLDEYRNWVFACVQARAEDVGNIELELKQGDIEVEKHELLSLLDAVNPTMTKQDLFFGTQAYLDLDGNAFWFLARDGKGKGTIREIWLLRPDRVSIIADKQNPLFVKGYVFKQADGQKIPFEPNQILHFKNFNPLGEFPFPHRGTGVVEAAAWSIDTDNEARQWNFNFFKNSARPDGVVEKDGEIGEDEYNRLKADFEQQHRGTMNAHKVLILTNGLQWKELSRSQKEMDFIEQRRMSRDEILAMFRTPKSVIGIVEDVNRANAEASNYIFALRTIDPLMKKIVTTLNEFLVPEFGDNLKLSYESPVPEDRVQELAEFTAGVDKWLTRNEIRKEEGLPPIKGGDALYGQFANVPIGEVDDTTEDNIEDEDDNEDDNEKGGQVVYTIAKEADPVDAIVKGKVEEFVSKLPTAKGKKKALRKIEMEVKTAYIGQWKAMFDANEKPLLKSLKKFFDKQKKEVLANLKREMKTATKEQKAASVDDILFDEADALDAGISLITPYLRTYIEQSGGQATDLVGAGNLFDTTTPSIAKFVEDRAAYFAKTINETTYSSLVDTLKEGTAAGDDLNALAERVAGVYDQAVDFRSVMIARTEVSASANFGAMEAYDQAGVENVEWAVVNPDDEDCLMNDGAVVGIGEAFPSGDDQPPIHPNCECTTLPVFA